MACIELRKIQQIKHCKNNHTSQLSTGMHLSRPKLLGNRRALDDLSFGDSSQSKTMYITQYETYCFIGSITAGTIQIIFLLAMRIWHITCFLEHHNILMVIILARRHLTCTNRAMSCCLTKQLIIRCFFLSYSRYNNGQVKLLTWSFLFCPSLRLCLATIII